MTITSSDLTNEDVYAAYLRVQPHIKKTPLVTCSLLNSWLGHEVYFKLEMQQKLGSFKLRSVANTLLTLQEQGNLPKHVACFSSGNHAQAVAYFCAKLGIKSTIFMPEYTSAIKRNAAASYGGNVVVTKNRQEAELLSEEMAKNGAYFLHPSSNPYGMLGSSSLFYEAFTEIPNFTASFTSCGGGGLTGGNYLASTYFGNTCKVIAAEPEIANDAATSLKQNKIIRLSSSPKTIADGARTLSITENAFYFLKKIDRIIEASEESIIYWTCWLSHLLKVTCEPTAALAMAAAHKWLHQQTSPQKILVVLSGGNVDFESHRLLWQEDHLATPPQIKVMSTEYVK